MQSVSTPPASRKRKQLILFRSSENCKALYNSLISLSLYEAADTSLKTEVLKE